MLSSEQGLHPSIHRFGDAMSSRSRGKVLKRSALVLPIPISIWLKQPNINDLVPAALWASCECGHYAGTAAAVTSIESHGLYCLTIIEDGRIG